MTKTRRETEKAISKLVAQTVHPEEAAKLLDDLPAAELLHAVVALSGKEQRALLETVSPRRAAEIVEELPNVCAADLFQEMAASEVASIVEELASSLRIHRIRQADS